MLGSSRKEQYKINYLHKKGIGKPTNFMGYGSI